MVRASDLGLTRDERIPATGLSARRVLSSQVRLGIRDLEHHFRLHGFAFPAESAQALNFHGQLFGFELMRRESPRGVDGCQGTPGISTLEG